MWKVWLTGDKVRFDAEIFGTSYNCWLLLGACLQCCVAVSRCGLRGKPGACGSSGCQVTRCSCQRVLTAGIWATTEQMHSLLKG